MSTTAKRQKLFKELTKCLEHSDKDQAIAMITGYLETETLEHIVLAIRELHEAARFAATMRRLFK